ncbi:uncharacterized protein LOC129877070 isoform X2 [Solanum dulcamara]|uniref:uncharacterized protein LOC129877070 isoform X2 n=1 Tax=Solanum dulcamara TaxID=45834 RepID=UPI002486B5AA|nr:uncharacterized protein LOC129877070 isoform X2 [Solanum dulcamara]
MVWCNYFCDHCARFIQPYYYGDLVCCSLCGKVIHEDNFVKTMARQSKKIDPEIEKNYEEMVEEDTEYGENKNYTKIEEECNSRRVWCDYCVKSISPPQYFVNKICCSYCGKVLLEDNFHLMARQTWLWIEQ